VRQLSWSTSFRKAFKKRVEGNLTLEDRVFQVLGRLAEDPYQSLLKSHKLSGALKGLWSCWVDYDCRIVFAFEKDPKGSDELIILVDIGKHDEVY
jgi:mRNA interferase YafQ